MSAALERTGLTRITLPQLPPSLNRIGARGNPRMFHRRKKAWQQLLEGELMYGTVQDAIPARIERVTVSGRLEFRLHRRRDPVNYMIVDKALGDALVGDPRVWPAGRWLPDDTPDHYRFTELELVSGCDEERTILDLHWGLA